MGMALLWPKDSSKLRLQLLLTQITPWWIPGGVKPAVPAARAMQFRATLSRPRRLTLPNSKLQFNSCYCLRWRRDITTTLFVSRHHWLLLLLPWAPKERQHLRSTWVLQNMYEHAIKMMNMSIRRWLHPPATDQPPRPANRNVAVCHSSAIWQLPWRWETSVHVICEQLDLVGKSLKSKR